MPARLFSFMNPLGVEIWLAMLGAYLLVSLTIWVVARFSPVEWRVPEPCCLGAHHEPEQQPEVFENDFTLANSFWFTIGTLMQQGSDLNPQVKNQTPAPTNTTLVADRRFPAYVNINKSRLFRLVNFRLF